VSLGVKGAYVLVWVVFAVLTAVAAIAVLLPYARARSNAADLVDDLGGSDAEVYKDQLAEIDKDVERGALSPAEADAARLEISRRLSKSQRSAMTPSRPQGLPNHRAGGQGSSW
jgi:cytochrome c-type biogenesis protein CcmH